MRTFIATLLCGALTLTGQGLAGRRAPSFSLPDSNNVQHDILDYRGKWLVLYVYPKDDTPGCTIQGKSFTASKSEFDEAGITVVGLSQDDVASHKNFCNKFSFKIDLLSDVKADIDQAVQARKARGN